MPDRREPGGNDISSVPSPSHCSHCASINRTEATAAMPNDANSAFGIAQGRSCWARAPTVTTAAKPNTYIAASQASAAKVISPKARCTTGTAANPLSAKASMGTEIRGGRAKSAQARSGIAARAITASAWKLVHGRA